MRKLFAVWLAIVMVLTMSIPATTLAAQTNETVEVSEAVQLDVTRSLFSLTEVRNVEVQVDFGSKVDLGSLEWQFGEKSLSEWKKWDKDSSTFSGAPFITVTKEPQYVGDTTTISAELEFGLPFDTNNLSPRAIRTQYKELIGNYELALIAGDVKAATTVRLNVYDEYLDWDEIKPEIDRILAEASEKNDRYLEYQSFGKSVEGRDLHTVILARDKEVIDKYLNETLPTALENPDELIKKIQAGEMGDYQVPVWFNNIHPDEVEGIDFQTELLKKYALESEVTYNTTNKDGQDVPVTLNMDEVLDHIIFIFHFSHNPDGRVKNTRQNANGFDLNRDNAYQTQVETIQVDEHIAKWTPLSMVEGHGYVEGFLVEPTTPPHNPNYEYDLLIEGMIEQAHAMGSAGIGNSALDSYFLPYEDWKDGWDDMSPSYTPMYAMLHGTLGHTVEVPSLSQDSLYAMVGIGLGATKFVFDHKDRLYLNQLKVFKRGIDGEDNPAVDKHYTNAAGKSIGRIRGENDNFFPDYYVLPTDDDSQKNALEAYNMVNYLIRNGVKVEQTTEVVTIDGVTYPIGTYIVPMNQAKRGLANAMLYPGDDVSDWAAMYDPVVINFPALRGFDIAEIRVKNAFAGKTEKVDSVTIPTSEVQQEAVKQVLQNVNNDTIKLVNELLNQGKSVEILQESFDDFKKGDYVVLTTDLLPYADEYVFEALPLRSTKPLEMKEISKPKVAHIGSGPLRFSLNELGFDLVEPSEADVIVSDSSSIEVDLTGKTLIGTGHNALKAVSEAKLLEGFEFGATENGHEGLFKATMNEGHLLTSGYEKDELLYTTSGSWITKVPEGAEVLATIKNTDDFFVAGWWPGHDGAKGQTLAFTKKLEDKTVTLFANDLAFRAHTKYNYRLIANSIFHAGE